ncbi:hypothetical protein C0J52_12698 [Blattella germanica]|nr:hypothetical protein C0J52_12698 [Blattella germanica]
MSNLPVIITSSRGGRKLAYNGYIYYRRDGKGDKEYWTCQKKPECKATAITIRTGGTVTILKESDHWHAPNQETVVAEFLVNRMKRVATEHPEITPSQILGNELRSVPSGVLSQIPEWEQLKRSIRRERTRNQLPDPTSIDELGEIPERYKNTKWTKFSYLR